MDNSIQADSVATSGAPEAGEPSHSPLPWVFREGENAWHICESYNGDAGHAGSGAHIFALKKTSRSKASAAFIVRACNLHYRMVAVIEALEHQLSTATSRIAELERDAARYRWLRENFSEDFGWYIGKVSVNSPDSLDTAIDAAIGTSAAAG